MAKHPLLKGQKVVAAWDRENGTTVMVYENGAAVVVVLPHDGEPTPMRRSRQPEAPARAD